MKKSRLILLITLLIVVLALGTWGIFTYMGNANAGKVPHIAYDNKTGHVIVQLFNIPGYMLPPSINAEPTWTLYGDGRLIFQSRPSGDLFSVQLSPDEVQHILNVIVQQNDFFASTQPSYGRMMPDVGSTTLTVNATGKQKSVNLFQAPSGLVDSETQHVFAIRDFLVNDHPAHALPYVPAGVALMAYETGSGNASVWPYNDISLSQIATEMGTAVYPVYGQRGLDLLKAAHFHRYGPTSQNNKGYAVLVWPLLPDALAAQPDGSHSVAVLGNSGRRWAVKPGPGSGTPPAGM